MQLDLALTWKCPCVHKHTHMHTAKKRGSFQFRLLYLMLALTPDKFFNLGIFCAFFFYMNHKLKSVLKFSSRKGKIFNLLFNLHILSHWLLQNFIGKQSGCEPCQEQYKLSGCTHLGLHNAHTVRGFLTPISSCVYGEPSICVLLPQAAEVLSSYPLVKTSVMSVTTWLQMM